MFNGSGKKKSNVCGEMYRDFEEYQNTLFSSK